MSAKLWKIFFFAFAFFASSPVGLAQTPPGEAPGPDTKKATSDPEEKSSHEAIIEGIESPGTEVVTGAEIRARQARSVPEALHESIGVHVQETHRGVGEPILRGFIGPKSLVVVDGVRLSAGAFCGDPGRGLAAIEPLALERIEIVRGPGGVFFGNGALGGVVGLVTAQPDIGGKHGAAGSLTGRLASADMSPGGALSLAAKADGLTLSGGGSVTRFGELRAGGGEVEPQSANTLGSWRAKAVQQLGKTMSLTAAYLGASLDDAGRIDGLGRGELRFYGGDDHLAYGALTYESTGFIRRVRLLGSYHRRDEQIESFSCAQDPDEAVSDLAACIALNDGAIDKRSRFQSALETAGVKLEIDGSVLENRLDIRGGLEFYHDWIDSSRQDALAAEGFAWRKAPRGILSDGSTYRTLGVFLHGDLLVWDVGPRIGQLHVTGGGRFFNFAAHAPDVPTIGDVSFGGNGFSGGAGLQLIRPELYNIYASFNQGFRSPALQETTALGDTGGAFEVPNDDLRPERIDTVEVGAKLGWGPLSFRGDWFYSFLRDPIDEDDAVWQGQTEIGGLPVVRWVNADKGRYTGVEGAAGLSLWRLTLGAGAAWVKGELTTGGETRPGRTVPPVFGKASVRYDHGDGGPWVEVFSLWAGRQDALHPSDRRDLRICETRDFSGALKGDCEGAGPWVTFNLRGGVRFLSGFSADVGLFNLTDTEYRLHGSGFDMPGFDARATLTYEM